MWNKYRTEVVRTFDRIKWQGVEYTVQTVERGTWFKRLTLVDDFGKVDIKTFAMTTSLEVWEA